MQRDTKKNYQLYGRNDMIMLDEHNKIYGSLGLAEPYIVATKTGETLLLDGAKDNEPFIGLSIYGKSHQKTVAGNQLLDVVNVAGATSNGVIIINNGDGSFTVTGTPTNMEGIVFNCWLARELVLEEGQYALSSGIGCRINKKDGTLKYVATSFTFNSETDEFASIYWQRDTNNYVDGETIWPMLNVGTTALPWEPYTGGQPSPNPDYPQEIESVGDDGDIQVDVYGGNLFDPNYQHNLIDLGNHWGVKRTIVGKNVLDWTTLPNDSGITRPFYLYPILPNTEYVITVSNTGTQKNWYIGIADSNGIGTRDIRVFENKEQTSFITEENETYLVLNLTNSFECMLNIGSIALPFEPYKQPQSLIVSTPNGFPGIPVSSGGNYTDENGQQWISDEVDFKRGKYVKRVRVLNAREERWVDDWNSVYPDESGNTHVFNSIISNKFRGENAFCTHFRFGAFNNPDNGYDLFSTAKDGGNIGVRASSELASTVKEWNQFIQQNDVIFACILKNPIETDLTPEQITAYQSLHTNYPTTTVMNDSDAGMKAIYKQIENGG